MINISTILKKCDLLKDKYIDKIIFEGAYPVLFTMTNGEKEYLVICPIANSKEMTWIISETSFSNLIELLTNKITIRDAFLAVSEEKICIKYDGNKMKSTKTEERFFPKELLPDEGEFLDAEVGEFDEEIEYYRKREQYRSIYVNQIRWQIYILQRNRKFIGKNYKIKKNSSEFISKQISFFHIPVPDKSYSTIGG